MTSTVLNTFTNSIKYSCCINSTLLFVEKTHLIKKRGDKRRSQKQRVHSDDDNDETSKWIFCLHFVNILSSLQDHSASPKSIWLSF